MQKGTNPSVIAQKTKVTSRRVYQIYRHYIQTGSAPVPHKIGRPKKEPTQKEIQIVTEMYIADPQGVNRLTRQLHAAHIQISYSTVRKIIKSENLLARAKRKHGR